MAFLDAPLNKTIGPIKTSKHLERQIGAFLISWSKLESELNLSFSILFRVDPTLAGCIYSSLGTSTKISILSSAIDSLSVLLGKTLSESAKNILRRSEQLNAKARNTVAHGVREMWWNDETKKSELILVRYKIGKKHSWLGHKETPDYWRRLTRLVESNAKAWRQKVSAMHDRLRFVDANTLQESVLIHSSEAPPILARSRRSK